MHVEYQPRPEYGLIHPAALARRRRGDGPRRGGVAGAVDAPAAGPRRARLPRVPYRCAPGESVLFGLHRSTLEQVPAHVWSQDDLASPLAGHHRRLALLEQSCTRTTRGRGPTMSTTAAGCCRR